MTAFTSFATLKTAVKYPRRRATINYAGAIQSSTFTTAGFLGQSAFLLAPTWNPGTAPGAAANPDNTSPGALAREASDSTTLWLAEIVASATTSGSNWLGVGAFLIYDRLAHNSGLDATLGTAQTTNLPLTLPARAPTNGVGCFAALEVYTAVGSATQTASVSYKNTAGSAKTTPFLTRIGAAPYNAAGAFMILPQADGDTGVKTVESVTLSGSTLVAGNFGCVIGQPLAIVIAAEGAGNPAIIMPLQGGNLVQIPDGACLQAVYIPARGLISSVAPIFNLELVIARAQ